MDLSDYQVLPRKIRRKLWRAINRQKTRKMEEKIPWLESKLCHNCLPNRGPNRAERRRAKALAHRRDITIGSLPQTRLM